MIEWSSILAHTHLSRGTANQYSGCFLRLPYCWTMAAVCVAKDFLIGFPTLMHKNMGGVLLFSSFEGSISELHMKNIFLNIDNIGDCKTLHLTKNIVQSPLSDGKSKHGRNIMRCHHIGTFLSTKGNSIGCFTLI